MINKWSFNSNLGSFFWKVGLNKWYLKVLKDKALLLLLNIKKKCNDFFLDVNCNFKNYIYKVSHVMEIWFSSTNTSFSMFDFSGKLLFFRSAGDLQIKGKQKKSRYLAFKAIKSLLHWKFKFLKVDSMALHLKNVKFMKYWIVKKLKKKLFIQIIKNFSVYPHNGCRKKKIRRKK